MAPRLNPRELLHTASGLCSWFFSFEVFFKLVELLVPVARIECDPFLRRSERFCFEPHDLETPSALACDELRALQHLEVLGDRSQRHLVRARDFPHCLLVRHQAAKDLASCRIGKSVKDGIEPRG